jgi:hypothetical protein
MLPALPREQGPRWGKQLKKAKTLVSTPLLWYYKSAFA